MSESQTVALPLIRVTLFEDRGALTHSGPVRIPAGRSEITVTGLSPLLDDARLTARCLGEGAPQVESVRVTRRWTLSPAADATRRAELKAARDAAEAHVGACERRVTQAVARAEAARHTLTRYVGQLGRAVWATADTGDWPAGVARLEAACDAADGACDAADTALADAQAALAEHVAGLDALGQRDGHQLVAEVRVRVLAATAGTHPLQLNAVTPCALWRPSHEAERLPDDRVRWTTGATVWQRTGLDWRDVELVLSTDRPAAHPALPPLHADRLTARAKADRKKVVLAHRDEAVATDSGEAAVAGVYDGGEARTLRIGTPVSVPSDGRPHRLAAHSVEVAAEHSLCCRPEAKAQVFQIARLHNASPEPILAGPVRLMAHGAWLGEGETGYVGPGEAFELSFGSDDRFRVTYARRRVHEKKLLASDRTHFVQTVTLQAVGAEPADVQVTLRLPVSELDALTVQPSLHLCSEGPPAPDSDGLVHSAVTLDPGAQRELSLGFWFDAGSEVVLGDPW